MYASQLLRILQTLPNHVNDEICHFDTDEQKATMKESPKRYTNPFLSDEENNKGDSWDNPEYERSVVEEDFTNNHEDEKFRKSLAPYNVPSEFFEKAKDFFTDNNNVMECELPEFLVCYKEIRFDIKDICVDEGIPYGERTDKDHHEVICNSIPVDEQDKHDDMIEYFRCRKNHNLCSGTQQKVHADLSIPKPTNDQYDVDDMIEEILDTQFLKCESSKEDCLPNSDLSFGTKEKVITDLPIQEHLNDHSEMGKISNDTRFPIQDGHNSSQEKDCGEYATKQLGTIEKVDINAVIPNALKKFPKVDSDDEGPPKCAPDELYLFVESNNLQSPENCDPDNKMQTNEERLDSNESLQQDQPLTSLKFILKSANNGFNDDPQPFQSPVEEISTRPLTKSEEEEEVCRRGQTTNVSNESKIDGSITLNLDTERPTPATSDSVTIANKLLHDEGESSFSMAVAPSGLRIHSGRIAFSGNISFRSDSSTNSTRSFAFPVLQTEWPSSPVRMVKPERRRLQKHRGWRHGLLCCRF